VKPLAADPDAARVQAMPVRQVAVVVVRQPHRIQLGGSGQQLGQPVLAELSLGVGPGPGVARRLTGGCGLPTHRRAGTLFARSMMSSARSTSRLRRKTFCQLFQLITVLAAS
jgi:hypothetical protein